MALGGSKGGRVYVRDGRLVVAFKDTQGKWHQHRTELRPGQEAAAERLLAEIRDALDVGETWTSGPLTVRAYVVGRWLETRKHLASWKDDLARLKQHVLPAIGEMLLVDVRPRHLRDVIHALRIKPAQLRSETDKPRLLAPRTIRSIYSAVSALFRDAALEGLIEQSPAILRRETLPKIRDADPLWRQGALFTAGEVESLISDSRIPVDRRVFYALLFLAGCRFGEAAALRWRVLEEAKPLDRLTLAVSYSANLKKEKGTKTDTPRLVPVHPTLAKMLASWQQAGWALHQGRPPKDDDLIAPSGEGKHRSAQHMLKRFHEDCARLGMRRRRQHDARRTFVSLALAGGADRESVKWIVHGRPSDTLGLYTEVNWSRLCAAVAAIDVLPLEGRVVELRPIASPKDGFSGDPKKGPGEKVWAELGQHTGSVLQATETWKGKLAGCTGLEPVASGVTGRRYNQLN